MKSDKLFEHITNILASTWVIGIYGLAMLAHTGYLIASQGISNDTYLSFISELAIFIGFLILRSDNIQAERQERKIDKKH